MNKQGPIVIIEDDPDDQMIFSEVFAELGVENEMKYFSTGEKALDYLADEAIFPFLILSDVNLPKLDGLTLKKMVHTNQSLSKKCIPYLFFTTSANEKSVYEAYTMSAQGFFVKPTEFETLKNMLGLILEYWKTCYSPNNFIGSI